MHRNITSGKWNLSDNFNKERMIKNVITNRNNSGGLMDSWYSYSLYTGGVLYIFFS